MKLGFNGKIYYLSNGSSGTIGTRATWGTNLSNDSMIVAAPPSNLLSVGHVQDCTVDFDHNNADASSRDGAFELNANSLAKLEISFKMIWDPTDGGQQALIAASLSTTGLTVPLAVLDGPSTTSGSTGWWADFVVQKINEGQPLKEGQIADVTVHPGPCTVYPQKVQVQ